jgi:hypothetical protein
MAIRMRITRIKKAAFPHEHTEVGGIGWSQPEDSAIDYIERGIYEYYLRMQGETVALLVANKGGRKYLATRLNSDGLPDDRQLRPSG